jgi:2'-5' RNA ligase
VRLFIAAYPAPEAVEHLRPVVASLALAQPVRDRPPRLSPPEQWHVTLAFLGEVPGREEAAGRAMATVAAGAKPFHVRLAGGGTFGTGRFAVVWAGLRGDLISLGVLADEVRVALKAERLPFDPRPFRPHLTLARPGDRFTEESLAGDLLRLEAYEGPLWTIDAIRLMRSHTGSPPHYSTAGVWPLSV